ncbi:MAG: group 1 truncated hemoglobin [Myxococcales bacterium]|nr:group 1 truncated hemoglobin [Myxococcales bacterium]
MWQGIGGEAALRVIVGDFVDRVFDDPMIGFFFRHASRDRIKEMEYQHAAHFLGGIPAYGGRPLRETHARHPIRGGHFERRKELLRRTLRDHGVPEEIVHAWIAHNESLRGEITADPGSQCR